RLCNTFLHPVDELGSSREQAGPRDARLRDRRRQVGHARVAERPHGRISSAAASTAALICGYAAHRHRLPLMYSATSASERACPSAMHATADMICPDVQKPH